MKSEKDVLTDVGRMKTAKMSLRKIAKHYGKPVTHGDIQRIQEGVFPKREDKRHALGLPKTCPFCKRPIGERRSHRRIKGLIDYSDKALRKMFENREEIKEPIV